MRCGRLDREELLEFYDVPTAYLEHLRRTTPTEGRFPAVARLTAQSQGCLCRETGSANIFQPLCAQRSGRWSVEGGHQ